MLELLFDILVIYVWLSFIVAQIYHVRSSWNARYRSLSDVAQHLFNFFWIMIFWPKAALNWWRRSNGR